jgi:hypothetical protein
MKRHLNLGHALTRGAAVALASFILGGSALLYAEALNPEDPEGPPQGPGLTLLAYFPFDGGSVQESARGLEVEAFELASATPLDVGGGHFREGRYGDALAFGPDPFQLLIPLDLDFTSYPQITVSFWASRADEWACDARGGLLESGRAADRIPGFSFLEGDMIADAAGGRLINYDKELVPGEWVHVVGVWDSQERSVRLYVDSTMVERTELMGLDPAVLIANERDHTELKHPSDEERPPERYMVLGAVNISGNAPLCNLYLDELRIYSGAMTPQEIAEMREADAPPALGSVAPPPARPADDTDTDPGGDRTDDETETDRGELIGWELSDDYELTGVSGTTANPERAIFEGPRAATSYIQGMELRETSNRPCLLTIRGQGSSPELGHVAEDGCDGTDKLQLDISFPSDGVAATGVQVCQPRRNDRVKGIRLLGKEWELNEEAGGIRLRDDHSQEDEAPNCNGNWQNTVSCGPGQVATGAVVHVRSFSTGALKVPKNEIVGLQLMCREMVGVYR